MGSNVRICKKCLLRDVPEEEAFKNMYEYIAGLPEEDKADEQLYEYRLNLCRECDKFLAGMCRMCGCFVEMRAAMKKRSCPYIPQKW